MLSVEKYVSCSKALHIHVIKSFLLPGVVKKCAVLNQLVDFVLVGAVLRLCLAIFGKLAQGAAVIRFRIRGEKNAARQLGTLVCTNFNIRP